MYACTWSWYIAYHIECLFSLSFVCIIWSRFLLLPGIAVCAPHLIVTLFFYFLFFFFFNFRYSIYSFRFQFVWFLLLSIYRFIVLNLSMWILQHNCFPLWWKWECSSLFLRRKTKLSVEIKRMDNTGAYTHSRTIDTPKSRK